ncbi:endonuclease MutS2 [Dethiosulfovibrio salsuginis]|uniref:Endonuclease MutS2 n=1 Tax=Dethiosulfovibrio salsuginis TaxID=561720 RepID=A0A1X7KH40_9BACT|nr:endonuclease MutS2 [Dethiosulfovibrio salsuginis]SMG40606.1 DNA mismatch repair protein MutS2 [Dethiosulfovibrio salsuginis]
MYVSDSVFEVLEIEKILHQFASSARSELGIFMLKNSEPMVDMETVRRRQRLIDNYRRFLSLYGALPWVSGIKEIMGFVTAGLESGMMSGEELVLVRNLLELATRIKESLYAAKEDFPELASLGRKVRDFSEEIECLSVLDDKGILEDGASPKLRDIRDKLSDLRKRVRKEGNSIINGSGAHMLQERVLSIRNGRSVVLVRQEFVGRFPGILVDRSSSGNSAYMEPNVIIPLNNRIVDIRQDELEEERRILRELTSMIVSRRGAIDDAQEVVATVDMLYAVSEVMDRKRWILPDMVDSSGFKFFSVYHPMLGDGAVPIDVRCGGPFRILVVTGPNTGGKTVALKTVGVAVVLAWSGLPIPAMEGSQVGLISALFADIGDEQSIEQSLSTFSAHLKKVVQVLDEADEKSLILLDELGAGTDPQEGAALGVALLKTLRRRGSLVLATTHHNPIKKFATTAEGVETASVDFDLQTLTPTYRLIMGIPGQSNALAIAERLGMHQEVLIEAKKALKTGEASVEVMIGELQKKTLTLESLERSLSQERTSIEEERRRLQSERKDLERQKNRSLVKADKEAEKIVEEAQNKAIEMLKGLDQAARSAAHRELGKHREGLARSKERSRVRQSALEAREILERDPVSLKAGDVVQISGSSVPGEILSLEGKKALVLMGGLKVEVDLKKLVPSDKKIKSEVSGPVLSVSRPVGVPSSIMVRGMTVDEAMPLVADYLDKAVRAGYGEVTVIHGRGEGILRRKVQELCRRLPYVSSFRLGENGEGGYGVTVVNFRE